MKKLQKIYSIRIFFGLILFLFLFQSNVFAADILIKCNDTKCDPSSIASSPNFFNLSDVWYPGKTATKIINVQNTGSSSQTIQILAGSSSAGNPSLASVLTLSVKDGSTELWEGTLDNLYTVGEIPLEKLGPSQNKDFTFIVSMDPNANDLYQNTSTQFDLTIGFQSSVPTPTTQQSNPSSSQNSSSNGDGNSGGNSTVTSMVNSVLGAFNQFGFTAGRFFPENILGETSPVEATPSSIFTGPSNGIVEGVKTQQCQCIWWQFLLMEAVILFLYFRLGGKDISKKRNIVGNILIVVLTFAAFRKFNPCVSLLIFCRYFILFAALTDIIVLTISNFVYKKKELK